MPKYVLPLLVKPKLKDLLSVLHYRLPRFRGKGQNQCVATFWRHQSIEVDRLHYKLFSICGPFRSKNSTWLSNKNPVFKWSGFLHEMRKCCIFRCAEKRWRGCRELRQSLSSIWSSVLAYVRHHMLFFFSTRIYLQHSARPVESDRSINIVFVRPSVW